ncbi:hypothetical protein ACFL6M_05695 [Candidatus Eisenbacteria bacterium]|uniref:Uncharacterized protein n=1 Tax=Eiseniibacteriota bacterium TaxID=2212470 RepID=A0ABV6YL59_UNCEI
MKPHLPTLVAFLAFAMIATALADGGETAPATAAVIVEQVIEVDGIQAAVRRFHEIKSDPQSTHVVDEGELNSLGYRFLYQGRA